jgi:hypothetical protein
MKTNTKIRLLVAALGGNVFSYNDARASEFPGCYSCERTFDMFTASGEGTDRFKENPLIHYSEYAPRRTRQGPDSTTGMRGRRPTITGVLSQLEDVLPIGQQERGLAQMIPILIKKHFSDALPAFVGLTTEGFKHTVQEKGINECSLEEFFTFSLVDPDTFQYVTRDQRPRRESIAIYGYATDAIMGRDGIINRIKRNIMDEVLMIIQLLITPNLPDEVVLQLEQYIDHLLGQIVPSLKRAMFEILRSDMVAEVATGCCGWCKMLKKEDKENLTRGICHMLGAMLGRIFGEGFEHGADELASGICSIIAAQSEA